MTKYVSENIKSEIERKQASVDIILIENAIIENIEINNYDIIGVAYPVHAFNAPKIVINFAKLLPKINSKNAFIIKTVGETNIINNSSSKTLIKILSEKGFNVFIEIQFEMPSNFIVKDDETKVENKICKVREEIPNAVHNILNLTFQKQCTNALSNIMHFIGKMEWLGLLIFGKVFYVSKDCINCCLCVNNCPNKNINMDKKHVKINRHCGLCMRCIYLCPRNSIRPYWIYRFINIEKWYENKEIAINKVEK